MGEEQQHQEDEANKNSGPSSSIPLTQAQFLSWKTHKVPLLLPQVLSIELHFSIVVLGFLVIYQLSGLCILKRFLQMHIIVSSFCSFYNKNCRSIWGYGNYVQGFLDLSSWITPFKLFLGVHLELIMTSNWKNQFLGQE